MKRIVLIIICGVFFAYLLVFLSAFNILGIAKIPIVGPKVRQVRSFMGLGSLFVSETSMSRYATLYRFRENGKWLAWRELEAPLFNNYIATGHLASLKHSRLDMHLSKKMARIGIKQGNAEMIRSKEFKAFTSHLFYRHNQNRKPDSLEVVFQQLFKKPALPRNLLIFKYKP
jgi:hypothetical protein